MGDVYHFKILGEIFFYVIVGILAGYAVSNINDICTPFEICGSVKSYLLMVGFFSVFGSSLGVFRAVCIDYFKHKASRVFKCAIYSHGMMGVVGWMALIISFPRISIV